MKLNLIWSVLSLWLWTPLLSFAQAIDAQTLNIGQGEIEWFDQQWGLQNSELLTCARYELTIKPATGHQFYESDQWIAGTIQYKNQTYQNISMLYDIEQDLLLIKHPSDPRFAAVALLPVQSQVQLFELNEHIFIKENSLSEDGFYEQIARTEHLLLLCKRFKKTILDEGKNKYISDDSYFLKQGKKIVKLKNAHAFYLLFPNKKKEIKKWIKLNHLTIRAGHDHDLKLLTVYCETLLQK